MNVPAMRRSWYRVPRCACSLVLVTWLPILSVRAQGPQRTRGCGVFSEVSESDPKNGCVDTTHTVSAYMEQDFLQPSNKSDRNYTMGFGFARTGAQIRTQKHDYMLRHAEPALDFAIRHIPFVGNSLPGHHLTHLDDSLRVTSYGELLTGNAFTAKDLANPNPVIGDRPYAFLLGWTVSRTTVSSYRLAERSEFTVGTIGSRLGRNVQRFIHKTSRGLNTHHVEGVGEVADSLPKDPKGWPNQIMDVPSLLVGIPTIRYGYTRQDRLFEVHQILGLSGNRDTGPFLLEGSMDTGGELGYYTQGELGLRLRGGLFSSPFWAWSERPLSRGSVKLVKSGVDIDSAPKSSRQLPRCIQLILTCADGFVYGSARVRATAYNALLQGYPGLTDYHIERSEREYFGFEYEWGVTLSAWWGKRKSKGIQITREVLARRSPEFKGDYRRYHAWGGVYATLVGW